MNSQIRKLAIIAFAAALPLGLAAQSGSAGSSTSGTSGSSSDTTRSGSTSTGSSSRDQSGSMRDSSSTGSSMSSPSSTSGSSTGSSYSSTSGSGSMSGMRGISRIDQDSIKQQFTATDLIGKDVYDNGGKKVGEVKDLVLGSAAASHLAMAFANSGSSDDSSSSGSSRSTTGSTGTTSGSTYGSTSGSGATGTTSGATGSTGAGSTGRIAGTGSTARSAGSSTLGSDVSSAFNTMSGMASEPAAIVSLGGFMGMGDNLVRVPLSQLNYDSSNEHLTLALSESELSSLTDRSKTGNAAE